MRNLIRFFNIYDIFIYLVFPDIYDQFKNPLWKYRHNKTINIVIRIPLINLLESGTAQAITFFAKNNPAI